ncbi:hypothetical protein ABFT23_19005 [Nocardioides sp. C4-1]|uniref:hypothetical protein n=1 Tax=Nocardioides sp. C4-1 TaxID=3151851 RepID=UPI003263FCAE
MEIVLVGVAALHVLLIVALIALVALDRVRVPQGGIWVAILLLVPVLGPAMVWWRGRHAPVGRS